MFAPTPSATARLGWHHFVLTVPANWEVLAFRKKPTDGQLVLHDREGERLQVYWKKVENRPALATSLTKWVESNVGESLSPAAIAKKIRELAGWTVFLPTDDTHPLLAGRFLEKPGILLSLILTPRPAGAAGETSENHQPLSAEKAGRKILSSFQPNDGPERIWAAFGLDFSLPAEFALDEATVFPAMQRLEFLGPRDAKVAVHRFGMMSALLADQDAATFFARVKGQRFKLRRVGPFRKDGRHEGVELHYPTKCGYWSGLFKRRGTGRVWLWRCPEIERLYALEVRAPDKYPVADLLGGIRSQ